MHIESLSSFSQPEKEVLLACLLHTLHDIDSPDLDKHGDLADRLLKEIDAAVNGDAPGEFVARIPEADRQGLWASMWAAIEDIHAPQDRLDEASWAALERWFKLLEVDLGYADPTPDPAASI